jgi:26S proteasome regulatory subunit T6
MLRSRGIDLAKIAEKLPGASGAEIKAVCTEAGMYALRERRVHVTQEDFEMAVSKVATRPVPSSHSQNSSFSVQVTRSCDLPVLFLFTDD